MIAPVFQSDNLQLAGKLLDAATLRQQAIAANVANLETPGYRRVDLAPDFAAQLKASVANGEPLTGPDSPQPTLAADTHARSVRPDGNSVEIEHELLAMNRNEVDFDFASEVVSFDIKQLKLAISGQST